MTFQPSAHGDTPPSLRPTNDLNGWSLSQFIHLDIFFSKSKALILTAHTKPYYIQAEVISTKSELELIWQTSKHVNSANVSSKSEVTLRIVHFYINRNSLDLELM